MLYICNMEKRFDDKVLTTLHKKGLTDKELAQELGCTISCICLSRKRLKLSINKKTRYSEFIEDIKKLNSEGKNDSEIARKLGLSTSNTSEIRRKLNLPKISKKFKDIELDSETKGILIGLILGDGHLSKKEINAYGSFAHSLNQKEYALYKYNWIKEFCSAPTQKFNIDKRNGKEYSCISVSLRCHPILTEFYPKFYKDKIKYISKDMLKDFNEASLAIFYMDDGTKASSGGHYLAMNNFTIEDIELFKEFLINRWNLKSNIHYYKGIPSSIYIPCSESEKFLNLVKPYIIESMKYKL